MRSRSRRGRDDEGAIIVITALLIIGLLTIAAFVVDLGDAQQQKREAQGAADAGALAGAQSLTLKIGDTPAPPGCKSAADATAMTKCVAAYDAFQSAQIQPSAATLIGTTTVCPSGGGCTQYKAGKATVEVTTPYFYAPDGFVRNDVVHVSVCWDNPTRFGGVVGVNNVHICGSASAKNTGVDSGTVTPPGTTKDCVDEDIFSDLSDNPRIYVFKSAGDFNGFIGQVWNPTAKAITPSATTPITHDMVLVAEYQSFDGGYTQPSLVTVNGPTTAANSGPAGVSTTVIQPSTKIGTNAHIDGAGVVKGLNYMMYSINGANKVNNYNLNSPTTQSHGLIAYEIPDDGHLKDRDAANNIIAYNVKFHAIDGDDPNAFINPTAATHCGNSSWTFAGTKDGKGLTSGSCGEDSFLANGVYPSTGTIDISKTRAVGAFYSDESHIQDRDYYDPYWSTQSGYPATDFGIILELSGGDFTDANGNPTPIPKSGTPGNINANDGYTLTPQLDTVPQTIPGLAHPDKYNTQINYNLPPANDPRWVNGVTYTIHLKAYDTDNNKAGNDCGQGTWSFVLKGATNGRVVLLE